MISDLVEQIFPLTGEQRRNALLAIRANSNWLYKEVRNSLRQRDRHIRPININLDTDFKTFYSFNYKRP